MSENPEEIIIIEDSDAAQDLVETQEEPQEPQKKPKNKKLLIFAAVGVLLVLIIATLLVVLLSSSKDKEVIDTQTIDEKLKEEPKVVVEPSRLENMIAKANYLYTSGSKSDALALFEKIAQYSEAISEYNLGVAQLKEKQYKQAIQTFAKAIQNDEKRCVSAINAAVCAIHLEDEESFKYYIDLAYAYLPHEIDSPLYSYYYALINYYNKNYIAALNALKNTTSNEYPNVQKNLSARINALFLNNYDAIEEMEKNFSDIDDFSIGLLYARVGDFTLAANHLSQSIIKNIEPVRAQLALGLINLKAGKIRAAQKEIQNVTDMFPDEVYTHYPIRVKLQESLFHPMKAQQVYRDEIAFSKSSTYQKIYYFSPYKIFNANQSISYIRKGNANIYIDNVKTAQRYLKKSSASSSVNVGITQAIQKALNLQITEANSDLQNLVKIQPKHSILQYNLALTYAQLGDMNKAHEHFLRSYYLDAKNYLSGIYAVMSAQLINEEHTRLLTILKDSIANEESSEEIDLYRTLLFIADNNYISAIEWFDNDYKERPLYLALKVLIALKIDKQEEAKKASTQLTNLFPNDILPHILYIDAHYRDLDPKKYATRLLSYLSEQSFDYKDLYHGPFITRYLFVQLNLLTGRLFFLREQLKAELASTDKNKQEIMSTLAMASLFDKQFEESFSLYNSLIDDFKMKDPNTLFLGAVAATGAEQHPNAIALLSLSIMKSSNFYDSRYALALLYLEVQNNEGAVIQLSKISLNNFRSKFFDFEIDTQRLLTKRRNP